MNVSRAGYVRSVVTNRSETARKPPLLRVEAALVYVALLNLVSHIDLIKVTT